MGLLCLSWSEGPRQGGHLMILCERCGLSKGLCFCEELEELLSAPDKVLRAAFPKERRCPDCGTKMWQTGWEIRKECWSCPKCRAFLTITHGIDYHAHNTGAVSPSSDDFGKRGLLLSTSVGEQHPTRLQSRRGEA
jgi:hypothetical protein